MTPNVLFTESVSSVRAQDTLPPVAYTEPLSQPHNFPGEAAVPTADSLTQHALRLGDELRKRRSPKDYSLSSTEVHVAAHLAAHIETTWDPMVLGAVLGRAEAFLDGAIEPEEVLELGRNDSNERFESTFGTMATGVDAEDHAVLAAEHCLTNTKSDISYLMSEQNKHPDAAAKLEQRLHDLKVLEAYLANAYLGNPGQ